MIDLCEEMGIFEEFVKDIVGPEYSIVNAYFGASWHSVHVFPNTGSFNPVCKFILSRDTLILNHYKISLYDPNAHKYLKEKFLDIVKDGIGI